MKKTILLLLTCVLSITGCKTKQSTPQKQETPECILKKAEAFSKEACEKGGSVKEYAFQNKKVFAFDHGSCGADMTTEVVDEHCKSLGFLGGFTGNVKINGEDFSNAVFTRVAWEK
jgi:hypothetical protein